MTEKELKAIQDRHAEAQKILTELEPDGGYEKCPLRRRYTIAAMAGRHDVEERFDDVTRLLRRVEELRREVKELRAVAGRG